ncbi:MAG: organoarsenical effux MFS transporter ArsJ [Acidimicrobiales bacterium]
MRLRNYAIVTGGYWAFTLTDGALRMLVLLHFHDLGYSPVALAFLFLPYEFMGIATNFFGGWAGARFGLNRTLIAGLCLQVVALAALTFQQPAWSEVATVVFVMGFQALSGVAKDLTKLSSKSAVKFVASDGALFKLVALLTGSKNALKGIGFFVGAALLSAVGYNAALWTLATIVAVAVIVVGLGLTERIGKAKVKPPFRSLLSKSAAVNRLSAARFFLFASRDIWFVVALPIFLTEQLGWSFAGVGAFLAAWVIGYGVVQSVAPRLVRSAGGLKAEVVAARTWALVLAGVSAALAVLVAAQVATTAVVVIGLLVFGVVFAMNSSLHSYLIVAVSEGDDTALDVGFYYSANAAGRFVGTFLSGVLYLSGGLEAALWGSALFVAITWLLTLRLSPSTSEVVSD